LGEILSHKAVTKISLRQPWKIRVAFFEDKAFRIYLDREKCMIYHTIHTLVSIKEVKR